MVPIIATDDWDMTFVGVNVNYQEYVRMGRFLALDELLPEYAPKYWDFIPQLGWDAMKVDGKIYAAVPMKDWARRLNYGINTTFCDEIGFDYKPWLDKFDSFADLIPMLYEAKALRDEVMPEAKELPIAFNAFNDPSAYYLYEPLISNAEIGNAAVINVASAMEIGVPGYAENEVFCMWDTPQYREVAKQYRQLIVDNIIPPVSAGFNPDHILTHMTIWGQGGAGYVEWDPDTYFEQHGFQSQQIYSKRALVYGMAIRNGLQSININSKNPERCVMLLELVNTDPEVMTTIAFGLEGRHWVNDPDNPGVFTWDGAEMPPWTWVNWYPWTFGTITNLKVQFPGNTADFPGLIENLNRSAYWSQVPGFVFDSAPISEQIAALDVIHPEYVGAWQSLIGSGENDNIDELMDEFLDKARANGLQEIMDEVQKQLDAYLASM